jgi:hypothetical protein
VIKGSSQFAYFIFALHSGPVGEVSLSNTKGGLFQSFDAIGDEPRNGNDQQGNDQTDNGKA